LPSIWRASRVALAFAVVLGAALLVNPFAQAQTFSVLFSFTGATDGGNPWAGLIQDGAGNLYGTTTFGGALGGGVVFKLDATGTETVLYGFTGGTDGGSPYGDLIRGGAGNLYGTTNVGGDSNFGVVFKVTP